MAAVSLMRSSQATIPPWTIAASVIGHFVVVGAVVVADTWLSPDEPVPLFQEAVQVNLVAALPQQQGIMVDKPSRTPDPPKGAQKAAATPDAPPPPAPKPDQLVMKDPEKPPEKGKPEPKAEVKPKGEPVPKDHSKSRAELLREQQKQVALKDMSAPLGSVDRHRTAPDGVSAEDAVLGAGGAMNDPVYAAYYKKIRPLVFEQWTVMEGDRRAHPSAKVVLSLKIAPDGTLQDPKVYKTSGVSAIDKAAVMAIYKLRQLPPPPAKYAAGWAKGTYFTLRLSDK